MVQLMVRQKGVIGAKSRVILRMCTKVSTSSPSHSVRFISNPKATHSYFFRISGNLLSVKCVVERRVLQGS